MLQPMSTTASLDNDLENPQLEKTETWKSQEESTLPNGGYGWPYAVFLAYYLSHDTYPDASALDYAFIGGLSFSAGFVIAPIVNFCVKHIGSKSTLYIGILFQTAAFIGASFATEIWQLYLSQGLSLGMGIACG
ncbi:hypothetical protein OIDMADRAFT_178707 [Oidiodendron maius Zn]|uniref:Major facilitator superfamily (MFS) profile domain-containing protein n=1 Tax=Oidiodendron maius (strain Zn) TaxID=913774 RepID=A0A0C3CV78_OIDMZ|nr:hypothetical protein OIDMADRAFT_178707 [Oidiodendron maius Zn]